MTSFKPKSICILGRQPQLGLCELESLYGAEHIEPLHGAALLDIPAEAINFKRLGGSVKVARLLTELPSTGWQQLTDYLKKQIPQHLQRLPAGKLTLGLSIYGLEVKIQDINRATLEIKKIIKQNGRPARIVPNKTPALSSAQVLHNKLTHKGGWELIFIANGHKTLLAQTLFVQDINDYAARDQARPKRDARVGMLPPKLAQIIINLAVGGIERVVDDKRSSTPPAAPRALRVLDPFCGTGVILQEALLMGYNVLGTDIEPRMADYSTTNTKWLFRRYPQLQGHVVIETADATFYQWPRFTTVASEVYLGQALNMLPAMNKLNQIIRGADTITKKFLLNLAPQLKAGQRICVAVPAWRSKDNFIHLPLIERLTDMGYNRIRFKHVSNSELIYYRENQIVARELLVLEKE